MKRIILVGYMGSGKTTVGKALAKDLGLTFYDLDWYIESRMMRKIPQIFAEKGEEGFRTIEYNMLREVAEFEDVVVSCGGGTPCFFDNMDYLNQQGETIYLKASPDVLYDHLKMARVERPLIKGKEREELMSFIEEQLSKRAPHYEKAKHVLNVDKLENYEKIGISVKRIEKLLGIAQQD